MKKIILALILAGLNLLGLTQENEIDPNGYNIFYHENGVKSSEGYMRDGKPDGYWKTYNEDGILISEGNRKNFKLDSLWKFYNDEGKPIMEVNYKNDLKNGKRIIYRKDEIIEENFKDDVKEGLAVYYYPDTSVKKTVNYVNGLEEGLAKEYAKNGRVITLITYKKGYITDREKINRFDQQRQKHGKWKYYYDNGIVRLEGKYNHGLKDGYFKEYDKKGNLISTSKYVEGEKQEKVEELTKTEIRKDYYPSGQVKTVACYKDGVHEGVVKEYSEDGQIEKAFIYKNGVVIGEGLLTEKGEKDNYWKEYYDDGKLKAEGKYDRDKRIGEWKFYHENGNLEQIGKYNEEGKYHGEWKWFYENGNLLREESYYNGFADGLMTEYDENRNIIAQGDYIEGLENGFWIYEYGDTRMEGDYMDGMRNGLWKHYYSDGKLSFKGKFVDDNPNGRHVYYWDNGNVKDEGNYIMGRKDGEWKKYSYDGILLMIITYDNGKEIKYDGIRIETD